MRNISAIGTLAAALSLTACSASRFDPCGLVSVTDAQSLDTRVVSSLWAGRGEPKTENEVCMFYDDGGAPRMMLFVWYENDNSPKQLVEEGSENAGATSIEFSRSGFRGAASFSENALALLALQSDEHTIGFRVREPVERDSPEFEALLQLSRLALARF